jgi:hypothetical protein
VVTLGRRSGPIPDEEAFTMTRTRRRAARLAAVAAMIPVLAVGTAGAAHADVTSVEGSAAGISAVLSTPLLGPVVLAPTPTVTLPPTGSATPLTDATLGVDVAGLVAAGVSEVSTQGTLGPGGSVSSSAEVADVRVGAALAPVLTLRAVSSRCTATEAGVSGDTTVADATVLGVPLRLDTAPNTVLQIAGLGTLHVNEQVVTGEAPNATITVNAVRVELDVLGLAGGEVVIGQSVCGLEGTGVVVP